MGNRIQESKRPESGKIFETRWKSSIAVLPFEDLSPQRDQEHLCEGMLDDIITKLSSLIPELKVISKLSVRQYKDTDKDIKEIGKNLEVATILESSLQIENAMIRVNVKLTNTKDGFLIWSKTYQKKLESYFEVQDEISRAIADGLQVKLMEDRFEVFKTREPTEFDAYIYYRKGKHYIEEKYVYSYKIEDFEAGVIMYEKAIEIEPDNPLFYLALGFAYEVHFNWIKNEKSYKLMIENMKRAYELDPNLAETNSGMGWFYFYKEDNDRAYQSFKRAFELDPNNSSINFLVGSFLRSIGLYHKAIKYYSRVIELSPLYVMNHMLLADCYMFIGEFEEAVACIKKAIDIEPDNFRLYLNYAKCHIMMRKYDEAEKSLAKAQMLEPAPHRIQYFQAWILAGKGERERALSLIKDAKETYHFSITSIYSMLGLKEEAIRYITEGIETSFKRISEYFYSYPMLMSIPFYETLQDDPRFKEIVKIEKEKYEEKLKKYSQL